MVQELFNDPSIEPVPVFDRIDFIDPPTAVIPQSESLTDPEREAHIREGSLAP